MADTGSHSPLSRRDFLRLAATLGGAAALASFLESCSPAAVPQPTPLPPTGALATPTLAQDFLPTTTPLPGEPPPAATSTTARTATVVDGAATVAFVKTDDRLAGVRQAIALLGLDSFAGKRLFLKPNFNSADPAPGSTHPDVLRALVATLNEMGAAHITVGDRSGMGDTRQVIQALGVFKLADELGFDLLVLDELAPEDWMMVNLPNSHWSNGFPIARPCLEAQALVQTCCLKTHRYGGHFTLSLKNSVGMVAHSQGGHNFMQELHSSSHQRRMIAEINAAYTPALIVMDGVEAFISGGPDVGQRVSPGVVLAATDRIALDAVGIALLRHFGCQTEAAQGKIFEQEQIAAAVELGLGVDSPQKIEFLTPDPASAQYSDQIKPILLAG